MVISQRNKEALKNPWVLGMLLFLIVFLTVNGIFIYYAFKLPPNLVDKNFYEDGENYLETQKKIRAQALLGWHGQILLPARTKVKRQQSYQAIIQGKNAEDLVLDSVVLKAYRPSDYRADFSMPMKKIKPGIYEAQMQFNLPGTWDLVLEARQGEVDFVMSKRIHIHP